MFKTLTQVVLIGFLAWAYQTILPLPPKVCGSPFGPSMNVCDMLKEAGLVCPNICCYCYEEMVEGTEDALKEISKALDKVCKPLQIPFAQTWVPCPHSVCWASGSSERKSYTSFDGCGSEHVILTTAEAACFLARDNLVSFWKMHKLRRISKLHRIRKGKGVVGRAFSSQNACFCKDMTKLSIIEYIP